MSLTETGVIEEDPKSNDDLGALWSGVVNSVSHDSPQNRAFLTLTKHLS